MFISSGIIHDKISGQLEFLRTLGTVSSAVADQMELLAKRVYLCGNKLALLGIEGEAAKTYYNALKAHIPERMGFIHRTKHPPKDRVNSGFSYSYTLLYNRVVLEIIGAGLDPYCGFLHETGYSRYTLACDLMEIFRAEISDRAAMQFLRNVTIRAFMRQQMQFTFLTKKQNCFYRFFQRCLNRTEQSNTEKTASTNRGRAA